MKLPTWVAIGFVRAARRRGQEIKIRNILVIRLDGIGDCVMTLPLVQQLSECFPDARVTVITRSACADIFRITSAAPEVICIPDIPQSGRFRHIRTLYAVCTFWWRQLRSRSFEVAVSPRWDIDVSFATLLCALSFAPIRIGFEDATTSVKQNDNRHFQNAFTGVAKAGPLRHEVLRSLELTKYLGCTPTAQPPQILIANADQEDARTHLRLNRWGPLLAVALPAGSPNRRWPYERYLQLLELLRDQTEFCAVIFTDDATAQVGNRLHQAFPQSQLLEQMSLRQTAAILAECVAFVGSDSALGHIAAAVGCATVTLSCHPATGDPAHTNSPIRFHPYGAQSHVCQPAVGRDDCSSGCSAAEAHCILGIDKKVVVEAALQAILSKPQLEF